MSARRLPSEAARCSRLPSLRRGPVRHCGFADKKPMSDHLFLAEAGYSTGADSGQNWPLAASQILAPKRQELPLSLHIWCVDPATQGRAIRAITKSVWCRTARHTHGPRARAFPSCPFHWKEAQLLHLDRRFQVYSAGPGQHSRSSPSALELADKSNP